MTIRVFYSAVDGARMTRTFKTIKGASSFARRMVGDHPDFGSYYANYAVSADGVGKVTVSGCTLIALFPPSPDWLPESYAKAVADKIDGYDRDDLGESPDY